MSKGFGLLYKNYHFYVDIFNLFYLYTIFLCLIIFMKKKMKFLTYFTYLYTITLRFYYIYEKMGGKCPTTPKTVGGEMSGYHL